MKSPIRVTKRGSLVQINAQLRQVLVGLRPYQVAAVRDTDVRTKYKVAAPTRIAYYEKRQWHGWSIVTFPRASKRAFRTCASLNESVFLISTATPVDNGRILLGCDVN